MVLYRAAEHRVLELLRNLALETIIPVAQRGARRGVGRVYRRLLKQTRRNLAAILACDRRKNDAAALDVEIQRALDTLGPRQALFPFLPPELDRARAHRFKLQERLDLDEVMRKLVDDVGADPSYDALADCVRRADAIADVPGTQAQMALEDRVRDALTAKAGAKIAPLARAAIDVLDKQLMETVRDEAKRARYSNEDVAKIDELLALTDEALTKLQLKKANEMDDRERVVNREIRLKQLMLETYASLYAIPSYAGFRDPRDWASRKKFAFSSSRKTRDKLAARMLAHQAAPIHCALTDPAKHAGASTGAATLTAKTYDKRATQVFKCLLGATGALKHPFPANLAAEALASAFDEPALRVELYAQLAKQLTDAPAEGPTVERTWRLLAAAFESFAPPAAFENQIALLVKRTAPDDCKSVLMARLYGAVYGAARATAIGAAEMPGVLETALDAARIAAKYGEADLVTASSSTTTTNGDHSSASSNGIGRVASQRASKRVPPPLPGASSSSVS